MADLTIKRFAYSPMGTFGNMQMPNGEELYTVEQLWRNNERNVSCIPEGNYRCRERFYNRGNYNAIHIVDVPDRDLILFHKGNTESDLQGCIAPGKGLAFINGQWAVGSSGTAFSILMEHFGESEFSLDIVSYSPDTDSYAKNDNPTIELNRDQRWEINPVVLEKHGVYTRDIDLESGDFKIVNPPE